MELGLKDKVVLVTGGSKGIGLACARAFLRRRCAGRDRLAQPRAIWTALRSGLPGMTLMQLRPTSPRAKPRRRWCGRSKPALGAIDVLVNSAGAAKRYLPEDLNAGAWHAAMDAKYFTYIHAMDAVLPGMAARGAGVVVNIIGMGGKVATPIHLPGGAANSALMLATVGLANVYGPKGIRVNAINPGATMTDRVKEALKLEAKTPQASTEEEVLAQGQAQGAAAPLRAPGGRRRT